MSRPIIEIRNVSKRYELGAIGATRLRDELARLWQQFRTGNAFASESEFWALTDVSFNVEPGDVVGIVGRNGAGKSTLLKILSRITQQTHGEITLRGRISSLLEVGTGFHPDLSGGENIFLNGAILGMTKAEIRSKFDEIVEFAGIERFIDTPVKRYSSGMHVRLAFAVAAHLEPEILIIDEVLAVGDAEFQKKCLGKMEEVSRQHGRTVLFVSHNLFAVRSLCSRAVLLAKGRVMLDGSVADVLARYGDSGVDHALEVSFKPDAKRPSITRVRVDGALSKQGDLVVEMEFSSPFPLSPPVPGLVVSTPSGMPVYGSNTRFHNSGYEAEGCTAGVLRMVARGLPLHPGEYGISVWLSDWHTDYDHKSSVVTFEFGGAERHTQVPPADAAGALNWPAEWSVERASP